MKVESEITKAKQNEFITIEADSSGTHYKTTYSFETIDKNNTRVQMIFEGTPTTLLTKLFSPFMVLFKGQIKKGLDKDLKAYKSALEQ